MAGEFGLDVKPRLDRAGGLSSHIDFDPYEASGIEPIHECVVAVRICHEQRQPNDGDQGTVSVRAFTRRHHQARLYP
jgi:hypothetical protein